MFLVLFGLTAATGCAQTPAPTSYYVDGLNGNDANSGLTDQTAWKSLSKVNQTQFAPGSSVYFKRGQTWRGQLRPATSGTASARLLFAAYGDTTLSKPLILGSINKTSTADWVVAGTNIWRSSGTFPADIGNIILNNATLFGLKKWSLADLAAQGNFWFDLDGKYLYIYSKSNPALTYTNIELAQTIRLIDTSDRSYITYQNLRLKYGSAHGVFGANASNITVDDMEISYMGGGDLYQDGRQIRYGNGIEFWSNASSHLVERNKIWEIYDTGMTVQNATNPAMQSNITFKNNLVWNCGFASIELWNTGPYSSSSLSNIRFENNTAVMAGSGWGSQRTNSGGFQLSLDNTTAAVESITIKNNIFYKSKRITLLVDTVSQWGTQLTMDNNSWYQTSGATMIDIDDVYYYTIAGFSQYQQLTGYDLNSITADPKMANVTGRDFHLKLDSPAIDRSLISSATTDYELTARPQGTAYDIGAYEKIP